MNSNLQNQSKTKRDRYGIRADSDVISKTTSRLSSESFIFQLVNVDLAQFCSRKFFYIFLVQEDSIDSLNLMESIVNTSKNFEDISSLIFITRDEITELLDNVENIQFPVQFKPLLFSIFETIKTYEDIPIDKQAQLVKLKLIQTMYEQYANDVKRGQKEKGLDDLLGTLTRECKKKGKDVSPEKVKSPGTEDTKKKGKKEPNETKDATDYLSVPLRANEIKFDENIFDNVWFYCITGYYDIDMLQQLIQELQVPICSIIKVVDKTNEKNSSGEFDDAATLLFKNIELQFFDNTSCYKYLEDTVLMEFAPTNQNPSYIFQEFLYVVRKIVDLKLIYLKYLRHLVLNFVQNKYYFTPVDCMKRYNRSLKNLPAECQSSFIVLDALLEQTMFNIDLSNVHNTESNSTISTRVSNRSLHTIHCTDPIQGVKAFERENTDKIKPNRTDMLVQENNDLLKILKSYKGVGPIAYDVTISLLKQMPFLRAIYQRTRNTDDFPHTHDVEPTTQFVIKNQEKIDHFMYLYLFNTFSNRPLKPTECEKYHLINNLTTYDMKRFWSSMQPKESGSRDDTTEENLYNTPVIEFMWKENLTGDIMLQELFKASQDYLYMDHKFSPETHNLLVIFSDKLDEFGTNTKIFENSIRTPICLRDFCRYVTVEEREWVNKNTVFIKEDFSLKDKFNIKEKCPGGFKIKKELKIYEEYFYLLNEENIEDSLDEEIEENIEETCNVVLHKLVQKIVASTQPEINFDDILMDLLSSPSSKDIMRECGNAIETDQLISYDLGSNQFKITGHETVFCSHDGIKIVIDNTKFLQAAPKCCVKIICAAMTLIAYSSKSLTKSPYMVDLLIGDDMKITFLYKNTKITKSTKYTRSTKEKIDDEIEEREVVVEEFEEIKEEKPESFHDIKNAPVVHCVEETVINDLINNIEDLDELPASGDVEDLLETIENINDNPGVIYKINPKTKYLKRLNSSVSVPIDHFLKGILSDQDISIRRPKQYETFSKRYQSVSDDTSDLEIKGPLDFKISFPNGLFIQAHSDVVDSSNIMVKQEFAFDKPKIKSLEHEEFRLFSPQGLVLIKKIDGTITILRSTGDIVNFENPNDCLESSESLKPCRCATMEDYKNKLSNILKKEENCDFYISRRAHITTRHSHIVDENLVNLLKKFDVPYLRTNVIKFDGKQIKIEGDKISEKQLYYVTSQQNLSTDQVEFERNDGFKSSLSKNGSQIFLFPDETCISINIDVSAELVDGFVYIILYFEYKHPNYASVTYDFDETASIDVSDKIKLKKSKYQDKFFVDFNDSDDKKSLILSEEDIVFEKICWRCSEKCFCKLNVRPFYKKYWAPNEEFLQVKDSYDKEFYSDYVGNCSRNNSYITGQINKMECNHLIDKVYKKLFVINEKLDGDEFLTKKYVESYISEVNETENGAVRTYKLTSDPLIEITDCRRGHLQKYNERFTHSTNILNFYKDMHSISQSNYEYSSFRVFQKIFDSSNDLKEHISNLRQSFFNSDDGDPKFECISRHIASVISGIDIYDKQHKEEEEKIKAIKELEREQMMLNVCACTKRKLTISEKINRWKREKDKYRKAIQQKQFPKYFLSDFCKINNAKP